MGIVENTPYGRSSMRMESRPDPMWFDDGVTIEQLETKFAESGVGARWIAVVDAMGSPLYRSDFIPTTVDNLDEREKRLKQWAAEIRKRGMVVISWYPFIINQSGAKMHPEWMQKFIIEDPPNAILRGRECCFNTGYGDALINFSNEAIDKFGLDGIWFDGSAWTQIWEKPVGLSCVCDSCRKLFEEQTGLPIPSEVDWSSSTFRRWVAWRYDACGAYIARLARGIREKHPNAAVVINHYHRPSVPWQSAIPLNPYDADIIYGSEATGEAICDLTTRMCRAYGRQPEVWRPLNVGARPDTAPETDALVHHACTCVTAGGIPSYGMDPNLDTIPMTTRYVAEYVNKLWPYVYAQSVPYAVLHVSQQTETFYLSRDQKGLTWAVEPFWETLIGWTQGLMAAHIAPDYVYDKDFIPKKIERYKVLLMPISFGLSDEQCQTALEFAKSGGTLVLGIAAGEVDEWGEKRERSLFGTELGFVFGSMPSPAAGDVKPIALLDSSGKAANTFIGLYTPITLNDGAWKVLREAGIDGKIVPAVASRAFGSGKVMLVAVDFPLVTGWTSRLTTEEMPISLTSSTAASGNCSLKCVDRPAVHAEMEMRFAPVGPPYTAEARLRCALRLGKGAQAWVEILDSQQGIGASVLAGRDGKLIAAGKPLCEVPRDTWFGLDMRFRLAGENRTWDVSLNVPGREAQTFENLPFAYPAFDKFDTAIIRGESTEDSEFFVDDFEVTAITGPDDSDVVTITRENFENGTFHTSPSKLPASLIADDIAALAPPAIRLDGPDYVHMGAFRGENGETIVHMHNINGSRNRAASGEPMTLRVSETVKSARLVFADKPLSVQKSGVESVIKIPYVSMHEVVALR